MRTTDPKHAKPWWICFERCLKNGYVSTKAVTPGSIASSTNLYVNEAKPGDPCPDCGRPTETVTEENFFFKLSAFTERLLKLYEEQPNFIQPETPQ
jgi:methionyl-tRNA synthetase